MEYSDESLSGRANILMKGKCKLMKEVCCFCTKTSVKKPTQSQKLSK